MASIVRRRSSGIVAPDRVAATPSLSTAPSLRPPPPPPPLLGDDRVRRRLQAAPQPSSSLFVWYGEVRQPERTRLWLLLGVILPFAPWIYHSGQNHRTRSLKSEVLQLLQEQRRVHDEMEHYTVALREQSRKGHELEHESADLLGELAGLGRDDRELTHHSNVYQRAERQENVFLDRIDHLHATIQNKSRQHAQQTWGRNYQHPETGTFLVNVTLTHEPIPGSGMWFLIETAPIHLMPHAVDHFLRLVERQLWDGLSLLHQAPPSSTERGLNNESSTSPPSARIRTAEISAETNQFLDRYYEGRQQSQSETVPLFLTGLGFAEHSSDYQLRQYSVVFEGRPGGPNFYIHMDPTLHDTEDDGTSTQESSRQPDGESSHHTSASPVTGEGGAVHHDDAEGHNGDDDRHYDDDWSDDSPHHPYDHHGHYHGEACFGLVVEGRDVLDGLVNLARDTSLQQAVGIRSVRLVPSQQ